jgi:hypothetical protein
MTFTDALKELLDLPLTASEEREGNLGAQVRVTKEGGVWFPTLRNPTAEDFLANDWKVLQ